MTAGLFYSLGALAQPGNPIFQTGKQRTTVESKFAITSGTSNAGDQFILGGPFTFSDRISKIIGATPALTSANDNDLGFFKKNADGTYTALLTSAAASAKDILWNGVDLSSALSYRELLHTLNTSLDTTKNIGQLLGLGVDQEPAGGVFLLLTTNTANTASTASLELDVVVDEATTV